MFYIWLKLSELSQGLHRHEKYLNMQDCLENMKKSSCLKPQGIERHFIRVYTICKGKKGLQTKEYNIFENDNLTPLDMYNGLSKIYCPEGRIH